MTVAATLERFDEKKIDDIFAPLNQCLKPGGAVGIAIGGMPVYRKGFGLANIELPALLGPTMRMRIGSTTKHFAAFAYMLLCEEGKAGIDDPIEKHIPEIHAVAHGITLRQLMGHTSGLRDSVAISMLTNEPTAPLTDAQMLAYYQTIEDVDFGPGTSWSYNNGGYLQLTAAIERLAGQTLDEVLRTRIFQPLGMKDTLLRRWERDFVPNSATLHMVDTRGDYTRDYMGMEITGMGGIVSTMDDMLFWLKHMDAPTVGSPETWRLMREPHRLANGSSTGYGLGLITEPYRGVETLHHGGGVLGGNSQMIKVRSAGLDITVAVNRSDVRAVDFANRIIDLLVDGLEPETEAKADAEKTIGVYISPTSGRLVELTEKEGMQLFSFDGLPGFPAEPDEDGVLQLPAAMRFMQTSFAPGEDSGTFAEFGNADAMKRVTPNRAATLGNHVGRYRSSAIATDAVVSDGEDGPRLVFNSPHGRNVYRLEPITDRVWRAQSLGVFALLSGIVAFDAAGQGFEFAATRVRGVRFTRG